MLYINKTTQQVWYRNTLLTLSQKEYQALVLLADNTQQGISRDTLMRAIWDTTHKSDSLVSQLISQLKAKFKGAETRNKDHTRPREVIKTIRGKGYQLAVEVSFTSPPYWQSSSIKKYLAASVIVMGLIAICVYLTFFLFSNGLSEQKLTITDTIKLERLNGTVPILSPSGNYIVRQTIEGKTDYVEIIERESRALVTKFKDSGIELSYWWANHSDILLFHKERLTGDNADKDCFAYLYFVDSGREQLIGNCTDYVYNDGKGGFAHLVTNFSYDDQRVLIADNVGPSVKTKRIRQYSIAEKRFLDSISFNYPKVSSLKNKDYERLFVGILPTSDPSILVAITSIFGEGGLEAYKLTVNPDNTADASFIAVISEALTGNLDDTITAVHQHLIYRNQNGGITAVNIHSGKADELLGPRSRTISAIKKVGFDKLFITAGEGFRMIFENVASEPSIVVPTEVDADVIRLVKIRYGNLYFRAKDEFGINQIFRSSEGKIEAMTYFTEEQYITKYDINKNGQLLLQLNTTATWIDDQLLPEYIRRASFYDENSIVFVRQVEDFGPQNPHWLIQRLMIKTGKVETLLEISVYPDAIQRDGEYIYLVTRGSRRPYYRWSQQGGLENLSTEKKINPGSSKFSVVNGKMLFKDIERQLYLYDIEGEQLTPIFTKEKVMTTRDAVYDGNNMVHLNVELIPYTGHQLTLSTEPLE